MVDYPHPFHCTLKAYRLCMKLINIFLHRDALLKQLKINLETLVNYIKQMADCKKRDVSFEVSSWVFLKLYPYRQQTAFKRVH
jgi:hypothetical protein